MRLGMLNKDEECVVLLIENDRSIKRRLQELGVVDGTKIKCLYKSPLGDPSAYLVRGAVIALRREDADTVLIERKEGKV